VHCRREPYDVLIDRATPLGNPFVIGRDGDRAQVIAAYERYVVTRPDLMAMLPGLRGKVLGCWCAPQSCHGDVLARLADAAPLPRVTAYWHASQHGLPCDLDYLRELGLRAWRIAAWYGIPPLKAPEGPFWVHTWAPWTWELAAADMAAFYGGRELPVPGPDYPVRAAVAAGFGFDDGY